MDASVFAFFVLFLNIALGDDSDKDVKLRFYGSSFENFTEFPLARADNIFTTTWHNPNKTTVIFCHGFTGKATGPSVTAVVKAHLEDGKSNVALLDWGYMASKAFPHFTSSYLLWALPNARQIGVLFADTLIKLANAGLNLNNTHLIGHSLGAQIFGITGYTLLQKGILLPWITGLDPASLGFENRPTLPRLTAYSANLVIVIHSDTSKYGFKAATGTVDFWPNMRLGISVQPGCFPLPAPIFSPEDLCSHHRSWLLWVDAVKYPGSIIGSYAKHYLAWKHYSQAQREAETLTLGIYDKKLVPGNYFFITKSESPYGLGKDGL